MSTHHFAMPAASHRERRERSRSPSRRDSERTHDSSSRRRREDDKESRHRGSHRRGEDGERRTSRKHDGHERRPRRDGDERRRRSQSESPEELLDLSELGVEPITTDDFLCVPSFPSTNCVLTPALPLHLTCSLKAGEFRYWLKVERARYLDELTSTDAHKYFRRFVRRWNDGALPRDCYTPHESTAARASSNTSYKWSFTDRSRFNSQELAAARASVDRMTHAKEGEGAPELVDEDDDDEVGPKLSLSPGPHVGPSLPTVAERQIGRETQAETARMDRSAERKAGRKAVLEKVEDLVPREKGKEGKMAEKKASNAENRKFADKDTTAGFEVDDTTLFGDDGGFAAA